MHIVQVMPKYIGQLGRIAASLQLYKKAQKHTAKIRIEDSSLQDTRDF